MRARRKSTKPRWKRGVDYPKFSGKSWRELEDLWPSDIRIQSEAWKIVSVIGPAVQAARRFQRTILPDKGEITAQDLYMLCWILRCEEARQGVGASESTIRKPMELSISLMPIRTGKIIVYGLIEQFDFTGIKMYRVTDLGKVVIQNFVQNLEQAHRNLKAFVDGEPPETSNKIDKLLSRHCPWWRELTSPREGDGFKDDDPNGES